MKKEDVVQLEVLLLGPEVEPECELISKGRETSKSLFVLAEDGVNESGERI